MKVFPKQAADFYDKKLSRYGAFNTHDALKLLALCLMVFDHIGWVLFPDQLWLRAIGRGTAPIFFFLIGYSRSYRLRWDLLLCAVALAVMNTSLSGSLMNINILVSFIIARLLLAQVEKGRISLKRPWDAFILLAVLFPSSDFFHYGTPGLLFAYAGYLQKHAEQFKRGDRMGILIGACVLYAGLESVIFAFNAPTTLLCVFVTAATGLVLWHYTPRPMELPAIVQRHATLLAWPARYSLWVYTLHLIAIQLLSGKHY